MATINYTLTDCKIITLEVDEHTALTYEQIEDETHREEERARWRARKKLNSLEEMTELGVQFASSDLTPEQALIKNEDSRRLHNALSKLPAEQRELIIRVYFKGEKQADIAREQGVTRKAINNRLERIYAQLKKFL